MATNGAGLPRPLGLLAELTHRCPLGCPYCSNPLALEPRDGELDAATWTRVFKEAAALGVLQVHLSGGEPASRRDLVDIMRSARDAGLYTNLITSGIGVTPKLPRGVRLTHNEAQGGWVLLAPERIFKADAIAVEILKRCTGEATFGAIVDDLATTFKAPRDVISADVTKLLTGLAEKKLLEL